MNKHINIKGSLIVAKDRAKMMWLWQSPPCRPCNPVPSPDPDSALPVPRYKGAPQNVKTIDERRKNWSKRIID